MRHNSYRYNCTNMRASSVELFQEIARKFNYPTRWHMFWALYERDGLSGQQITKAIRMFHGYSTTFQTILRQVECMGIKLRPRGGANNTGPSTKKV